jgi:hypothetical protein
LYQTVIRSVVNDLEERAGDDLAARQGGRSVIQFDCYGTQGIDVDSGRCAIREARKAK